MVDTRHDAESLCKMLERPCEYSEELRILERLSESVERRYNWAFFVNGWGRGNECYDLVVVRWILNRTGLTDESEDDDFLNAVIGRLRTDPHLVRQISWYSEWSAGMTLREHNPESDESPAAPSFTKPMSPTLLEVYDVAFSRSRPQGDKIFFLLQFAGMLDWPELVLGLNCGNVTEQWNMLDQWLKENARYLYFHESTGCFVVDPKARAARVAVLPSRQQHPFPDTPVPARHHNNGTQRDKRLGGL